MVYNYKREGLFLVTKYVYYIHENSYFNIGGK